MKLAPISAGAAAYGLSIIVPSPSWPRSFLPQQRTAPPVLMSAQPNEPLNVGPPIETCAASVSRLPHASSLHTSSGPGCAAAGVRPHWPPSLAPKHSTVELPATKQLVCPRVE